MPDPNVTKLFAPELIPQPLELEGPRVNKYTHDLYDYLRRLAQKLAQALGTIEQSDAMVIHGRVRVTRNTLAGPPIEKFYLDGRDWRGRSLDLRTAGQIGNTVSVETVLWIAEAFTISTVGANENAGFDIQLFITNPGTAGNIRIWIETGSGKLYITTDAFGAEFQLKYTIVGHFRDPTPNIVV